MFFCKYFLKSKNLIQHISNNKDSMPLDYDKTHCFSKFIFIQLSNLWMKRTPWNHCRHYCPFSLFYDFFFFEREKKREWDSNGDKKCTEFLFIKPLLNFPSLQNLELNITKLKNDDMKLTNSIDIIIESIWSPSKSTWN